MYFWLNFVQILEKAFRRKRKRPFCALFFDLTKFWVDFNQCSLNTILFIGSTMHVPMQARVCSYTALILKGLDFGCLSSFGLYSCSLSRSLVFVLGLTSFQLVTSKSATPETRKFPLRQTRKASEPAIPEISCFPTTNLCLRASRESAVCKL